MCASALFGVMFYLSGVVNTTPEIVLAWRLIITVACYALLLLNRRARRRLVTFCGHLFSRWWLPLVVIANAALVGLQMWLFAWTPVTGHALDASLGYLLLPIALVLVGRLVFRERVSRLQWTAAFVAAGAVGVNIAITLAISWVTLVICGGYALYFAIRRRFGLTDPFAFGAEALILLPAAMVTLVTAPQAPAVDTLALVWVAGLAGTVAMTSYLAASRSLSMPVFGLLSYVEPVLLFAVALLLGESLHDGEPVVYIILAVALTLLAVDRFRRSRRGERIPAIPRGRGTR